MMKFSLVCLTLAVVIVVAYANIEHEKKWNEYVNKHGKKYASTEEAAARKKNFLNRHADITLHNELYDKGLVSYQQGHNHLSDKTPEELSVLNGARNVDAPTITVRTKRGVSTQGYQYNSTSPVFWKYCYDTTITRPASIDLRTTGWNEPVRDQGSCGSCWAFSTSSVMSFYQFNKTKVNYIFSPQNLVDCDGIWNASGCNGASPAMALEYFEMNKQNLESDYAYTGVQKACARPLKNLFSITGFYQLCSDQASLEQTLYKVGAAIVSIDADGVQYYKSGVFDGSYVVNGVAKVCTTTVNHAVTAIGYGTDAATGKNYWLIKNSWSANWGESGYFRMVRNSTSVCGIYKYVYTAF